MGNGWELLFDIFEVKGQKCLSDGRRMPSFVGLAPQALMWYLPLTRLIPVISLNSSLAELVSCDYGVQALRLHLTQKSCHNSDLVYF